MESANKYQYCRDNAFPGVEIYRAVDSSHAFPRHYHDDLYTVCLMEKGASSCVGSIGNDPALEQGQLCVINPGEIHAGAPVGKSMSYTALSMKAEAFFRYLKDMACPLETPPEFRKTIFDDSALVRRFIDFSRSLFLSNDILEKQSAFALFFLSLLEEGGAVQRKESISSLGRLETVFEFLSTELSENISIDEAADIAGVSKFHFIRLFTKNTGVTPYVYRTQKRLELAKSLLRRGEAPAEVALDTGFSDQSHFHRIFRKYIGATPEQYRRASSF